MTLDILNDKEYIVEQQRMLMHLKWSCVYSHLHFLYILWQKIVLN